ncbi:hypothetical protein Hanom_Chr05g00394421 [Helianthus anomalus]
MVMASHPFPDQAIFRSFDINSHSDLVSRIWFCFLPDPFILVLTYPFPPLISEFFRITGLSYARTTIVMCRVLLVLDKLVNSHGLNFYIPVLASVYNLRTHGSNNFVFQILPCQSI